MEFRDKERRRDGVDVQVEDNTKRKTCNYSCFLNAVR